MGFLLLFLEMWDPIILLNTLNYLSLIPAFLSSPVMGDVHTADTMNRHHLLIQRISLYQMETDWVCYWMWAFTDNSLAKMAFISSLSTQPFPRFLLWYLLFSESASRLHLAEKIAGFAFQCVFPSLSESLWCRCGDVKDRLISYIPLALSTDCI